MKKEKNQAREVLKTFALLNGAPGFEGEVSREVIEHLKGVGRVERDRLGSVLVEKKGSSGFPRVMLAAHMDEVAFMVKAVHPSGLIRFVPLGGWWAHVLPSQRVTILTTKGEIPGVVGAVAPHHLSPADKEKLMALKSMFIDIGAKSDKEVKELGIEPGQPILPQVEWREMASPDIVSCKAFDDRVGIAMMVQIMKSLKKHPNTIIAAATAQEEVGIRGAKTAVTIAKPDVAIILEGPPADDYPGCAEFVQGGMGKGPQIRAYDPTMVTNPGLVQMFRERAEALKVPFQIAVRETGGTDAAAIHLHSAGVPSIVIGIPVRHAHSHLGLLSMKDFEVGVELVLDIVSRLDEKKFRSLTM